MYVFTYKTTNAREYRAFFRTKTTKYLTSVPFTAITRDSSKKSATSTSNSSLAKKTLPIRRKIRRGWGGKNRNKINFSILACNANGLKGKFESLKNNINYFKPSCILIQESKLRSTGSHKLNGYQIFEFNRQGAGGGLFTAIDENLNPVLIRTGEKNLK